MSRHKKNLPLLENIEITSIAAEGKAVARVNDMVVFIPYGVPGDIVDAQIKRKKHNYAEAEIVSIKKKSDKRCAHFCRSFEICGGCKWQQIPYSFQLGFKQQQVMDQLTRIGKIDLPEINPILGSARTTEYRNKLEFGCANRRWLTKEEIVSGEDIKGGAIGFHIAGCWDKILPIEKCHLMDDLNNRIRHEVDRYVTDNGLQYFDAREHTGLVRNLMIRNSNTGEWMVVVQFANTEGEEANIKAFMQNLADKFPEISSLIYVINDKCNDTIGDLEVHTFRGNDFIFEEMEGLRFKVGPKSFYQTNTEQAYILYKVVRDFASLQGTELVYDLYTGTGTIANFVARDAQHVIGIEYVPEAIEDAKENSAVNGIENTEFYAGDMKDILNDDFIAKHGRPDVIITDPPRAGMHHDVVDTILRAAPRQIVYVSCNPATQARDLALLDVSYRVEAIQPVDMFPHTAHVENVVKLQRR